MAKSLKLKFKPPVIMMVHAHPDDETIFTGGTIARYTAQGTRVILVTCTRGEFGEIHDPDLDPLNDLPRLGAIREKELRVATEKLGVKDLVFLGFHDSNMAGHSDNLRPEVFIQQPIAEAIARLVSLIRHYKPEVIVTYDESGGYGHPDHIRTHEITVAAFKAAADQQYIPHLLSPWQPKKLYYAVVAQAYFTRLHNHLLARGITLPTEDPSVSDLLSFGVASERVTTIIDTAAYGKVKRAALHAHRTQASSNGFLWQMADAAALYGFGEEYYILASSEVPLELPENDLLAGLAVNDLEKR